MKGIIFKEFLDMVENSYGYEMVDTIIRKSDLESNGAYTTVGTYSHQELVRLVVSLSKETDTEVTELLKSYGTHAFKVFEKKYSSMFKGIPDSFSFLSKVENTIHIEVLKLYPEAELPEFDIIENDAHKLVMVYKSSRKLADFAEGLILGCFNYFNEKVSINRQNLNEDSSKVQFTFERLK